MDQYLQQFGVFHYEVPVQLRNYIQSPSAQIVSSWFIVQCQTSHVYLSLRSCREALSPACSWPAIGTCMQRLLDVGTLPPTLLPMNPIGQGNTTVLLGHFGTSTLTAIKQQVFLRGSWEIPAHILAELLALKDIRRATWAPEVFFHSVTQDMVQIGMEFVPLSMKQMVRCGGGSHRLEVRRRLFRQLLAAILSLHTTHNRIHRDLKPDNIRFRSNGELVLIDYDSCAVQSSAIEKTVRVCTPGYRDPFLFDATTAGMATYDYRKLDCFSAGAVFAYLLQGGKHLFPGNSDAVIRQSMHDFDAQKFCDKIKLPARDRRVLCGLLSFEPGTRMSIKEAGCVYKNTE